MNKNDNQDLIKRAQKGDEEAVNMLLFKYDSFLTMLCYICIKKQKNICIEFSELKHIARIALFVGLKTYDYTKSTFKTFMSVIVCREINKYIMEYTKRNNELKKYIYFEDSPYNQESFSYEDLISGNDDSVTKWYENNEDFDAFCDVDEKYFSKQEKEIIMLKSAGYSHLEISRLLNISNKTSDRAIKKMKKMSNKIK